jgi:filamentous hemagglutinin family protein
MLIRKVQPPAHHGTLLTLALLLLLMPGFVLSALAQDAITADGTMNTQVQFEASDYAISGGKVRGGNQFHSFGRFNVPTDQSATFKGADTIQNIIGRVTGGDQSLIDGLLRSEIDGANLFLLNPNGIIFGPNASLDIKGAFHASTADYLRLGEDGILFASIAEDSVLTMAPPSAFGFLNANPAGIAIDESILEMPEGQTFSMVGGDITIHGDPTLSSNEPAEGHISAPGGRINLASVASAGEVGIDTQRALATFDSEAFDQLGSIEVAEGAYLDAGGAGGGSIIIRGGQFLISGSSMYASTKQPAVEGQAGEGIDVEVTGAATLTNAFLGTHVLEGVEGDSGGIRISGDSIDVNSGSLIASVVFSDAEGNSGDLRLDADRIVIDNATVQTGIFGDGQSGDIDITAGYLAVQNAAWLFSPAGGGTGDGGDINITADELALSNEYHKWGYISAIMTQTYNPGTGKGGDITIDVDNLSMSAGTEISTPTFGWGAEVDRYKGGNIDVTAHNSLAIEGADYRDNNGNPIWTGIFANTFGSGQGGGVEVSASHIEMSNQASMQSSAFSYGNAGRIAIDGGSIELKDSAYLISSGLFGWGGSGGHIAIDADNLSIIGRENSPQPFGSDSTGINTTAGYYGGTGGDISLTLRQSLYMTERGSIRSGSVGPGQAGEITIMVPQMEVLNGSNILSSAYGEGDGGNVNIFAEDLHVDGVHPMAFFDSYANQEMIAYSAIASQAGFYGGSGGDVNIDTNRLRITDGGTITAESFGAGDGGDIRVRSETVTIDGINRRAAEFQRANGYDPSAARSAIATGTDNSRMGADLPSAGGDVDITAGYLRLSNGGMINTATETMGDGGKISATARHIDLIDNALITSESTGGGDAGDIVLTAIERLHIKNSAIETASESSDGGNIKINVDYMVDLWGSVISASVGGGAETTGGNINIDPEYVLLYDSQIMANAFGGQGGSISIVGDNVVIDPESLIDASSKFGIDGTVDIQATTKPYSSGVVPLSNDYQKAVTLLREPCMARMSAGRHGSLIVNEGEARPLAPGGLLPSPLTLN